jgi:3-oxoadipyl-CoA thiolase
MDAFIIDGIRTPIGRLKGSLSAVRADDLAAIVIKELLRRNPHVPAEKIDDVVLGCANQAGEDNRNVARMALLLAGLPLGVPGETINRLCASGMSAVVNAGRAIALGDAQLVIAGGVENMTRGPYVVSKSGQPFGNDAQLFDSTFGWRFVNPRMKALYGTHSMGETAENLVDKYKISRQDQDGFAVWSQQKAARASGNGRLAVEIVSVEIAAGRNQTAVFAHDEFIRSDTTLEALANLRPVFRQEGGSVTAGNSSGLNDGAQAILISSEDAVKEFGLRPLARIVASAVVGVEPSIMGIGPVEATRKALNKAGLRLKDMDIIELNEAFAAQCLACLAALGIDYDDERINPNGGAIALGHPLGMSGARITFTAAWELHVRQKRFALATMCIGVGQGYAVILEKV